MFSKLKKTKFPPDNKPILIWDGECDFCAFWVTHWKKKTGSAIDYNKYQQIASHFSDIPLKEFKKASRLITTDGSIYSGPDSAYKALAYSKKPILKWHKLYNNNSWFRQLSDYSYNFIAKNRPTMFKLTKFFFGNNPNHLKPYWLIYLISIILLCIVIL